MTSRRCHDERIDGLPLTDDFSEIRDGWGLRRGVGSEDRILDDMKRTPETTTPTRLGAFLNGALSNE